MNVDAPYFSTGDWMATVYAASGCKTEIHLYLDPKGRFERVTRSDERPEHVDSGGWHLEDQNVLALESDAPNETDRVSDRWSLLSVTTCERSNCIMVLRWLALASRNLPILFYRVHLPGRWYSKQLGMAE